MQQGGGSHSHPPYLMADQSQQSSQMVVEEASPISSRPPATSAGNLDDFMRGGSSGGGFSDMDALATAAAAGEDAERSGGGGGGGNRWPRQETLALLRIRSEMDAAFRDATVKGPLWEDVSRKLAELGYKRSAKKCKEKFENVDKYYKRTKEGRAGRPDGKTYKFFTELEALHNTSSGSGQHPMPTPSSAAGVTPSFPPGIGFSSPMPISSIRPGLFPTTSISPAPLPPHSRPFQMAAAGGGAQASGSSPMGLDFSTDGSYSSPETDDDEEDNEGSDLEGEPSNVAGSSRKRKRGGSSGGGGSSSRRTMEFFEGLMKQVMQKQEVMQQKFLEAIEKREQDRLIREEAWRRQELARLAREHEIMAQERAVSASRDASIMAFLQKITGQTISLPTPPPAAAAPIAPTQLPTTVSQPIHLPPQHLPPYQMHKSPQQPDRTPPPVHPVNVEAAAARHPPAVSVDVVLAAVPEQQVRAQESGSGSGRSSEPPSSRWPKTEVIALIKLRSGLESRYQEAGPKGPLWEEISAGMQQLGYRRSSKRCKEKWENINKYFKKVKESNKKRPEDGKTCPYFHELDALYRKKIIGGSSSGSIGGSEGVAQQVQHTIDSSVTGQELQPGSLTVELEAKDVGSSAHAGGTIEEGSSRGAKKPEDTVKESIGRNSHQHNSVDKNPFELQHRNVGHPQVGMDKMEEDDDDDIDEEDDDEDEELQEERKMAYKIEFQPSSRQNAAAAGGPPNGGGNGASAPATTSFMAMVQ